MMKRTILLTCLAVVTGTLARAQQPAATPPPDPQVPPVPAKIDFVKSFTYVETPVPANEPAKDKKFRLYMAQFAPADKIEVLKDGRIGKVDMHYPSGTTKEFWTRGEYSFVHSVSDPSVIVVMGPGMNFGIGGSGADINADFREVSWVTRALYTGEEMLAGIKCYAYKDKAGKQMAWIDEEHRLPIAYWGPTMKVLFTYKAPPPEPLDLPDDCKKKWAQIKISYPSFPD